MTAAELIADCQNRGVFLWKVPTPEGEQVRYRALEGTLTETIRERLRNLVPVLLPLLPDSPPDELPTEAKVEDAPSASSLAREYHEAQTRMQADRQARVELVLSAARRGELERPKRPLTLPVGDGIPMDKECDPNAYLLGTFARAESFAQRYGAGYELTASYKALSAIAWFLIDYFAPLLTKEGAGKPTE